MFFEKMFAHKEGKTQEAITPTVEKSSVLGKAAKMAALFALLNMPQLAQAQADNAKNSPEKQHQKIEDVRINLNHLISMVEKNSDNSSRTIGQTNVKSHAFASGEEVIVAEGNKFIMISQEDNSRMFFDDNADGVLDRLIINKEEIKKDGINDKFLKNNLYAFTPVKEIIEENDITADIKPEKIILFAFDSVNTKLSMVDGEEAGHLDKEGAEAAEYITRAQEKYNSIVESLVKEK